MKNKKCNKCFEYKELSEFYKCNRNKDGYFYHCKNCDKLRKKERRKDIDFLLREKGYNKLRNSKEEIKKLRKEYQLNYNKLSSTRDRLNNKYKSDINFKMSILLRNQLNKGIKHKKITSVFNLLKLDIDEFKLYIEQQFKPEMNWDNHGVVWELDHIIPCASFDLTLLEEQQKCFHYSNYQPLFKTTKIAKSFGYENEIGNRNKYNNYIPEEWEIYLFLK